MNQKQEKGVEKILDTQNVKSVRVVLWRDYFNNSQWDALLCILDKVGLDRRKLLVEGKGEVSVMVIGVQQ